MRAPLPLAPASPFSLGLRLYLAGCDAVPSPWGPVKGAPGSLSLLGSQTSWVLQQPQAGQLLFRGVCAPAEWGGAGQAFFT